MEINRVLETLRGDLTQWKTIEYKKIIGEIALVETIEY